MKWINKKNVLFAIGLMSLVISGCTTDADLRCNSPSICDAEMTDCFNQPDSVVYPLNNKTTYHNVTCDFIIQNESENGFDVLSCWCEERFCHVSYKSACEKVWSDCLYKAVENGDCVRRAG